MDHDASIIDLTKSTWRPEWSAWNILVTSFLFQIKKQFSESSPKERFLSFLLGLWFIDFLSLQNSQQHVIRNCGCWRFHWTCANIFGDQDAHALRHPVIRGSARGHPLFPPEKPRAVSCHCGGVENACFGVDATVWKCSASPTKEAKKELRQQENGCNKKTLEDVHTVWLGWIEYEYASFLPVIRI